MMPQSCWQVERGRPVVAMTFYPSEDGQEVSRVLLADTGAGTLYSAWDVILTEEDCRVFQWRKAPPVSLGGAFTGTFPTFYVRASIPALRTSQFLVAVAVPAAGLAPGTDGIAAFRFLNAFNYGNFGDGTKFCLGTL